MYQEERFYKCQHCGNMVAMVEDKGGKLVCCGSPMTLLTPNTVDAAAEKHLPAVSLSGTTVTVSVGSIPHPMTEEHHISWVYLVTEKGIQRQPLKTTQDPVAVFAITEDDKVLAALEYCNLHGLWKTEL